MYAGIKPYRISLRNHFWIVKIARFHFRFRANTKSRLNRSIGYIRRKRPRMTDACAPLDDMNIAARLLTPIDATGELIMNLEQRRQMANDDAVSLTSAS
jgi:hypothetical protein